MTPDGIQSRVFGAICGRAGDTTVLRLSHLLPELQAIGTRYSLFADGIYPWNRLIKRMIRQPVTPLEIEHNDNMARLRVSVEHGFKKSSNLFQYMEYVRYQKVHEIPVGILYLVAILFTNCHTCFNGSQVGDYFHCAPPSLEDYLTPPQPGDEALEIDKDFF
jgi:hypothetical protein